MAINLLNVAEIIKKPSGLVFIYDSDGKLLQTIKDTKEIRRVYTGSPIPNTIGWSIQFTFDDNESHNVEFAVNNLTLIQYAAGKFQTYPDLGSSYALTEYYSKFESVYAYLANYVFLDCCETDPDNPIFAYPTNTWANWLIALNAGLLPKGLWIEVTAIPSQPSAIFSMFCTETNEIALGGFGQFLNADWQNVGDYSGVLALTTIPFTTNACQWYSAMEAGIPLVTGDVVIWNCLHYQCIDDTLFDGNDPATNTSAYTLLPKATANMGYITEVDQIEFVFVDDWLQMRSDKRGNYIYYSQSIDAAVFGLGYTGIDDFQWGRDLIFSCKSQDGYINELNQPGTINVITITAGGSIRDNVMEVGSMISIMEIQGQAYVIDNVLEAGATLQTFSLRVGGSLANKTFQAGITLSGFDMTANLTFPETITTSFGSIYHCDTRSNYEQTVDATGLTNLDLSVVQECGIYNIASSNATETINLISGFPNNFPFTLKPETGLTLTVTFTAVGSLSANDQIVGQSVFVVLNGDNGDELTLQAATFGAYSVTEQVELNQNN